MLSGVVVAVLAASAAPDLGRAQAPFTREQVLAALARATPQHPADFTGMDLSGLDLAGIDFKRANLTKCRLRSEEHTSELQSHSDLVCRLLLEKKNRARQDWYDRDH